MPLYRYVKVERVTKTPPPALIRVSRIFPFLLIIIGLFLVGNAAWPIISYELITSFRFQKELVKPISQKVVAESRTEKQVLGQKAPKVDYAKPDNWFPSAPKLPPRPSKITHYALSIPKLEIIDAIVEIGGEDLYQALIHYPGTALPGQYGNVVIFGHSVLPQFFSPKNYKTIFSTLPTLEEGDEVFIDYDGISYRYVVTQMVEVGPDDISVLEQWYDSEYLSLITCVPPGTYMKRLIVRAKLVEI
jgi:sortase A